MNKGQRKKQKRPNDTKNDFTLKVGDFKKGKNTPKPVKSVLDQLKLQQSAKKDQRTELLSLKLPCEDLYNYMVGYKMISMKKLRLITLLIYCTLVMLNSLAITFLGWVRPNYFTNRYTCFYSDTNTYSNCGERYFCACEDYAHCVVPCYGRSNYNCSMHFRNWSESRGEIKDLQFNFGKRVYLKFEVEEWEEVTLLQRYSENDNFWCNVQYSVLLLMGVFFIGGGTGEMSMGFLAERYGKKVIIIVLNSILILNLILISIYSYTNFYNPKLDQTAILITWTVISFFMGFCIFHFEALLYLLCIESYPDKKTLKTLNGLLHSHYAIAIGIFMFMNQVVKVFRYFFFFSLPYFIVFLILFIIYAEEPPRYYSERKNIALKRKSILTYYQKALVKQKNENGEEELFTKHLILFDPKTEEVDHRLGIAQIKASLQQKAMEEFFAPKKRSANIIKSIPLETRSVKKITEQTVTDVRTDNSKLDDGTNRNQTYVRLIQLKKRGNHSAKKPKKVLNAVSQSKKGQKVNHQAIIQSYLVSKGYGYVDISICDICRKLSRDPFLKKYRTLIVISWLALSVCQFGVLLSCVVDTVNPNIVKPNKSTGVIIYTVVMTFSMPILLGTSSIYISSYTLIIICLFVFGILCILFDIPVYKKDSDRTTYYGPFLERELNATHPINKATALFLIITVQSLFELHVISSILTLYRTLYHSILRGFTKLWIMLIMCAFYYLETPMLLIGITALFTCGFFLIIRFRWKEEKLEELIDANEYDEKGISRKLTKLKQTSIPSVPWIARLRKSLLKTVQT